MQAACILAEDGRATLLEQKLVERSARILEACDAFLKITEDLRPAFKHNRDLLNSSHNSFQAVAQCKLHAIILHSQVLQCKEEHRIEQSYAKGQLMHKQHELDRLEKQEKEVMRNLREQGQLLASILQSQGSRGLPAI